VYGFIGVETVTIISTEARSHKSIAWTCRWISCQAVLIAFGLAVVEYLNVSWQDARLPKAWFQYTGGQDHYNVLAVIAAQSHTDNVLPGLIVGCLIYTTVSSSNTVLYVASRALYGVLRITPPTSLPLRKFAKRLGSTQRDDGVPVHRITLSVLSFWWLPLTTLTNGDSVRAVSRLFPLTLDV